MALGGNYEAGSFGLMLGAYFRSFRNASPALDFNDVDEGIVALRPHLFFGELGGIGVEGSYQVQERGLLRPATPATATTPGGARGGALTPNLWRLGVIPFLTPAGRGDYSRPQFRLIYAISSRNQDAKALYPQNDAYSIRSIEHFLGLRRRVEVQPRRSQRRLREEATRVKRVCAGSTFPPSRPRWRRSPRPRAPPAA